MKKEFLKYLQNERVAREEERKLEAKASGKSLPKPEAPASAVALDLEEKEDGKWEGPCPACRAAGNDRKGNHLVVWANGAWGCVANRGAQGAEHRQEMARLAPQLLGKKGGYRPQPKPDFSEAEKALKELHSKIWNAIVEEFATESLKEALGQSGFIPEEPREQFLLWADQIKIVGEKLWLGKLEDSREAFARHLFDLSCEPEKAWEAIQTERLDVTRLCLWKYPELGRTGGNAHTPLGLVIEHDGAGWPEQIGLWAYCKHALGLNPRYVVKTGGKGGHGIFDIPDIPAMDIKKITTLLIGLGVDKMALGNCATRIPGASRRENGNLQELVWRAK